MVKSIWRWLFAGFITEGVWRHYLALLLFIILLSFLIVVAITSPYSPPWL